MSFQVQQCEFFGVIHPHLFVFIFVNHIFKVKKIKNNLEKWASEILGNINVNRVNIYYTFLAFLRSSLSTGKRASKCTQDNVQKIIRILGYVFAMVLTSEPRK